MNATAHETQATIRNSSVPASRAPRQNRRSAITGAALEILGEQGSRALTHRAIDRHLNLPAGTTSAYFRRRADLVGGAVRELLRQDLATFETSVGAVLDSHEPITFERVLEFYCCLVCNARQESDRPRRLARYECFLLARRDPETANMLEDLFKTREALEERLFFRLGVADPEAVARRLGFFLRGVFLTLTILPEADERLDLLNEDFLRLQIGAAIRLA